MPEYNQPERPSIEGEQQLVNPLLNVAIIRLDNPVVQRVRGMVEGENLEPIDRPAAPAPELQQGEVQEVYQPSSRAR